MTNILVFVVLLALAICGSGQSQVGEAPWRIHTLFSTECNNYFDWQTVGMVHSHRKSGQPGPITRLLSCTDEEKKNYKGMDLAPTMEVPSMSQHPRTGDWYPAINKPAGVLHWLEYSKDAQNVDWVVVLDADMIIRGPIIPWELGVEKGRPVAAYYGYLIGCDNILAKLHTTHPELCDKVGGLLAFHIDDLRALAPFWLSKTEEVRGDRAHWSTNITGDIYGTGWISEMYGYSFGAAEIGLRHKIVEGLMLYPGYVPLPGVEPILFHYGLPFSIGNWSFSKLEFHGDAAVYECRLFLAPPLPREVMIIEKDHYKRQALMLSMECITTLNEGLLLHHAKNGCPKPKWSRYLSFIRSKTFADMTKPKKVTGLTFLNEKPETETQNRNSQVQTQTNGDGTEPHPKIHTIFSTECSSYFDWQTVGFYHSFKLSGQPGNVTRLLSCTDEELKHYTGHDLAPTHYAPSLSTHPLTGDWYPAINKPAAVLHWLNHAKIDAEFIVILDTDMIMRGPITPWEFNATRGRPVSAPYNYLIGCDNELAKLHTKNPQACDKVGGVIIMHIDDLRKFALLWLHKTEEVRADREHYATNITGDIYQSGWISEMYGYSFGAAELKLRHTRNNNIMLYPGYVPARGVHYRVFHYGLRFSVGNWSWDKAEWRKTDLVNKCWAKFPDPPDPATLEYSDEDERAKDMLSVECITTLNQALFLHHKRMNCDNPNRSISFTKQENETEDDGTLRKLGEESGGKSRSETDDEEASNTPKTDQIFSSFRFWIVGLWAISFLGFIVLMLTAFSSRTRRKGKGKQYKSKMRKSHSAMYDMNGADRHLRTVEVSAEL